jgi:plastocyanin
MRGTAIRAGLVAGMVVAGLLAPGAGPAQAGGGCHRALTQGEGDTVAMVKACFTPSILRVDPGTEVTFVNKDPIVHNVSANGWGQYEDMFEGDVFTATFGEEGVYPFACNYHAGMTGAVVVGDGTGAGSGASVMGPSALTEAQTAALDGGETVARRESAGSTSAAGGWIGGGFAGLILGAGLALVWRRGRKEPAAG